MRANKRAFSFKTARGMGWRVKLLDGETPADVLQFLPCGHCSAAALDPPHDRLQTLMRCRSCGEVSELRGSGREVIVERFSAQAREDGIAAQKYADEMREAWLQKVPKGST